MAGEKKKEEKKSMIIVVPSSDQLTACTATLGPIYKDTPQLKRHTSIYEDTSQLIKTHIDL